MSEPLVSICIPTYQRARPLADLLASLAPQLDASCEVLIAEEPSADAAATAEVVAKFAAGFARTRHIRNAERLTFDRNFLQITSLARGTWCWMLGDDDIVEPGGVALVQGALRADPTLTGLTLGHRAYDQTLAHRIYQRPFLEPETRRYTDPAGMCLGLLDRLGFLSATVLHRGVLAQATSDERHRSFIGSGYVQLWCLLRMMQLEPRWLGMSDPCVGWRADNDSFNERGLLGRLRMDVEGYASIIGDLFGAGSEVHRRSMSYVARSHARHHIVRAKLAGASTAFSRAAFALCWQHYRRLPSFWRHTFPLLLLPGGLLGTARSAYQAARASFAR